MIEAAARRPWGGPEVGDLLERLLARCTSIDTALGRVLLHRGLRTHSRSDSMPRLHAKHRTEIRYAGTVGESVNEIRLMPLRQRAPAGRVGHVRDRAGAPSCSAHRDVYGNEVRWFQLTEPHESLVVESEAVVVTRPGRGAGHRPAGAIGFAADRGPRATSTDAPSSWPARPTSGGREPVGDFARRPGLDREEGVPGLGARPRGRDQPSHRLHAAAPPRSTRPVEEVVRGRPRRVPGHGAPDDRRLPGATASPRATSAAGCTSPASRARARATRGWRSPSPGCGWVEFDPTHPAPQHEHYVRLAIGPRLRDVPPLRGSYLGPATEEMTVTVEVKELPS